jgi:hypothetical protein
MDSEPQDYRRLAAGVVLVSAILAAGMAANGVYELAAACAVAATAAVIWLSTLEVTTYVRTRRGIAAPPAYRVLAPAASPSTVAPPLIAAPPPADAPLPSTPNEPGAPPAEVFPPIPPTPPMPAEPIGGIPAQVSPVEDIHAPFRRPTTATDGGPTAAQAVILVRPAARGWEVIDQWTDTAAGYRTKGEAVIAGRALAATQSARMVVYSRDGQVQSDTRVRMRRGEPEG